MSAEGTGGGGSGWTELLEAILRRLTRPEIVEGALGDLEEARGEGPGWGLAVRARHAAEANQLVLQFARERFLRWVSGRRSKEVYGATRGWLRWRAGMRSLALAVILLVGLAFVGGARRSLSLRLAYEISIHGAHPSPQAAFQSLMAEGSLHLHVPITYAGPEGCARVWFVLSQGYGTGGGALFVESEAGWAHFPEPSYSPQLLCLALPLVQ